MLEDHLPWAVVQNLLPFGYRIESAHRTRAEAEHVAERRSSLITVMPTAKALAENKRLEE